MKEVDSMRTVWIALVLCLFVVCVSSESFGNGAVKKGRSVDEQIAGGPAARTDAGPVKNSGVRSVKSSCRIITNGQKPVSAMLEDCVAYALDIPLAMLTPFVTAITPVMDTLDYGRDKRYPRRAMR